MIRLVKYHNKKKSIFPKSTQCQSWCWCIYKPSPLGFPMYYILGEMPPHRIFLVEPHTLQVVFIIVTVMYIENAWKQLENSRERKTAECKNNPRLNFRIVPLLLHFSRCVFLFRGEYTMYVIVYCLKHYPRSKFNWILYIASVGCREQA